MFLSNERRSFNFYALLMFCISNGLGDLCNNFNDTFNTTKGCITFSHDRRSWYDARNQCLNAGGDLASLDNASQLYRLQDMFKRYFELWIGLRKTSWRWNLNNNGL